MRILINATNLKMGGAVQVIESICDLLYVYSQDSFIVVLSSRLNYIIDKKQSKNVKTYVYDIKNNFYTLILGRDVFLDSLVQEHKVDAVLTIFGPSRWNPKVPHLSGFALSQLVLKDSPYFKKLDYIAKFHKWLYYDLIVKYMFKRSSNYFWTENQYITKKVESLFKGSKVYTITNYYNQIYDNKGDWIIKELPPFNGCTLLTITTFAEYKNLTIAIGITEYLVIHYPDFNFRFVFSCNESDFPKIENRIKEHFLFLGSVHIKECPSLYQQCDIVFHPTLLECFSAVYVEAMRMKKPIITTDLDFAHSICRDAAIYYSPLSEEDAAESIYKLYKDNHLKIILSENGTRQLKSFDNYNDRVEKLISITKQIASNA